MGLVDDQAEAILPAWFIFGEHADGAVDVCDKNGEVLFRLPRDVAERLIRERDESIRKVLDLLCEMREMGNGD